MLGNQMLILLFHIKREKISTKKPKVFTLGLSLLKIAGRLPQFRQGRESCRSLTLASHGQHSVQDLLIFGFVDSEPCRVQAVRLVTLSSCLIQQEIVNAIIGLPCSSGGRISTGGILDGFKNLIQDILGSG